MNLPPRAASLGELFTPEHISYLAMYDSYWQGIAHKVALFLVVLLSAAVFVLYRRPETIARLGGARLLPRLVSGWRPYGPVIVILAYIGYWYSQPGGSALLLRSTVDVPLQHFDAGVARIFGRALNVVTWELNAHWSIALLSFVAAAAGLVAAARSQRVKAWLGSQVHRTRATLVRRLANRRGVLLAAAFLLILAIAHPAEGIVFAVTIGGVLALYSWSKHLDDGTWYRVSWLMLLAYASLLMVPGLLEPLMPAHPTRDAPGGVPLSHIEIHFAVGVGAADRLALGRSLYDGANPHYGILFPSVLGSLQRSVGLADFGSHIRIIQALQIVFLLLAVAAYRLWKPQHPIYTIVPVLLLLPWIHNNHLAVLHPNQSAWRFMGLPLAILALIAIRRKQAATSAAWLGIASGLLMLVNVETAIASACGFGVFLLCRTRLNGIWQASIIGRFVLCAAATAGIAFTSILILAGNRSSTAADLIAGLAQMIGTFSQGYGGLPLKFDPVALLIFTHAVYIIIRAAALRARGTLSYVQSFDAAVAMIIVVWATYYLNRPDRWNLWTFIFLYGFLVARYLNPRLWSAVLRQMRGGTFPLKATVVVLVLGPLMISTSLAAILKVGESLHSVGLAGAPGTVEVSGIWLKSDLARAAAEKASFLRDTEASDSTIYLTGAPYLIPLLSRVDNRLKWMDPFSESFMREDFDALKSEILRSSPQRLLFDDPADELSGSIQQRAFFDRLKRSLGSYYQRVQTAQAWEIWERTIR